MALSEKNVYSNTITINAHAIKILMSFLVRFSPQTTGKAVSYTHLTLPTKA